jgi:hypothetical protein
VLDLLMLFVIYNNERFIVDHSQPLWPGSCAPAEIISTDLDTRTAGRDFSAG